MDHTTELLDKIKNLRIVRRLNVKADMVTMIVTITGEVMSYYHKQLVSNAAIKQNIWNEIKNKVAVD